MKADDLSIDATSEIVVIKGAYKTDVEVKEDADLRKDRRSGMFHRTLELPS